MQCAWRVADVHEGLVLVKARTADIQASQSATSCRLLIQVSFAEVLWTHCSCMCHCCINAVILWLLVM